MSVCVRALAAAAPVIALLPVCWLATILLGGEATVPPLWFFAPVLLAAVRGGVPAAVLTAQVSGVLAGPLTPEVVATGEGQLTGEWVVRTGFFVAIGVCMAVLVSRLRRETAEHRTLAFHDPLTGLANRALLEQHLTGAVARARRAGTAVVLIYIDLDDFKVVNDNLGHSFGDDLLCKVAARLDGCARAGDVLARQGGDEFLLMLSDIPAPVARDAACAACERIAAAMQEPFVVGHGELQIGASMGVSVLPDDADDAAMLRQHADAAMYRAKTSGSDWAVYTDASSAPLARLSLAARLRRAIEDRRLELHYQPIFRLLDGRILGVEALARWAEPSHGVVAPGDFIPVAEKTGVIDALGDWVLGELCRQAKVWLALGLAPNVGINVSPRQLRRPGFATRFIDEIGAHGLEPKRFVVELTESAWTLEADRTRPVLAELRAGGLQLALDDFGAGYSSLARLLELPIDVLKIDRSLLAGVPERQDAVAVLTAIQRLAEACRCDVVAEGVETAAQHELLAAIGCRLGQGFGLGRPVPAAEATELLTRWLVDDRRRDGVPGAAA